MKTTSAIYQKLEAFIKKYYMNELIKGGLLFIGFGLLYFLFTLFIEYFLWLKPLGRTLLFWIFIGVEVFLLFRFILFPIFKLFKLQKGIDYNQASAIIGNHFTEVSDKLTNFLQLSASENSAESSELMLASIEQKANSLQPIPFGNAINFNSNKKYLPLALIPILLFGVFFISGNSNIISQSLNRVVHFNAIFLPPAPFKFVVLNQDLQTEQNKDFVVKMESVGNVVPENVMIHIGDESYFMESSQPGKFEFKIEKPVENVSFSFEGNSVSSDEYELKVITVPSIANFEMVLNFPSYLKKKSETIQGTGNAIVPEGTLVTWKMKTQSTQEIVWKDGNAILKFNKAENEFKLAKNISQNTEYQILTSNKVKNYEKLDYQLSVITDQHPTITVSPAPDSLKLDKNYVLGRLGDDYGLSKLQIVYYERNKPNAAKRGIIPVKQAVFDQFVFSFPSNLAVEEGVSYEYYFEVFDNDAPHGFKSTKSSVFSDRVATIDEIQDMELQQQNDNINSLEKSLKNQTKQFSEMDKIQKTGKEKDNLEFKDQQKVNDFIKRQKQQDELMKQFAEKMNKNLNKFQSEKKDKRADDLQKRLDNAQKDLEKNQKLMDELKNLNEKLQSEELFDKMEKFKQISKNQSRNLEQLVELTKRFYVEKKAEQVAEKLDKLAEQQEKLSNKEAENTKDKQDDINKAFDKIKEDLKDLKEDNKSLKSPIDIPSDASKEKEVDSDLQKASDELAKKNTSLAKPKQKSAAKKMKSMSQEMQSGMEGGDKEQLEEDVAMLRQVLDNLLAYSLSQEDVMKQFKSMKLGSSAYTKNIKIQQNLKQQFKHVDDSLFAMSLRNPKIAEDVTKEIGNVQYNMDKAIETLTDVQVPKGVSHQQYATSSANKLADFLSDLLNNMQMSMSKPGAGKPKPGDGQGMQLPDIIQKQKGLGEKMKEGMKQGQKQGDGKEGQSGEGKQGQGKQGQGKGSKEGQGKEAQGKESQGKNGERKNGQGSKNGGEGKDGENGNDGEGDAEAIMEIYKEQVKLREALQKELAKQGLDSQGKSVIDQMKASEKQLLNKGFKNENLQRILNIQQELLKLNNAVQQQGEDTKRQSETNKTEFTNRTNALPGSLLEYLNSVEILNRQSLPLRSNFNQKVQEYFNTK